MLTARPFDPAILGAMAGALRHRGPDDEGVWHDQEAGIGLAHRRLAIVDLSPAGHQPMASADGRFVIAFNGEIYNHLDLRKRLDSSSEGPDGGWRGHSDTETLVEAIARWGVRRAVEESVGMFAFAAWDRRDRRLHLVRDRFGEKPLYYGWSDGALLFGSELKALRRWPTFAGEIDRQSVAELLSRGFVGAPSSIYKDVFKVPPATILTIDSTAPGSKRANCLETYWSYADVVDSGLTDSFEDESDALATLEEALRVSIEGQSIADVPVGAFLSGGIDSSAIVALYQAQNSSPVRTYTIGFNEAGFDEARSARAVAAALGTVHHEHYVGVGEARDVIPMLPTIYDEPFADSSQIPTYLVSKFARTDVTVALTGDGGDELFGGYNRHVMAPRLWNGLERAPLAMRKALAPLRRLPVAAIASFLPGNVGPQRGERAAQALRLATSARRLDDVYAGLVDQWHGERSPVLSASGKALALTLPDSVSGAVRLMHADATGYLPDDILCKVDRASMAVSLETRVPFLDHRVAAVAARIPLSMKIRGGTGKAIVRKLLGRHLDPALFERPKAGFAVPIGEWIKGPLRPWAEDLLDERKLATEGWLDASAIRKRWRDHLSGRRDSTTALWSVLMFQAWLRTAT